MSTLSTFARPVVEFAADNAEHRQLFTEFMRTTSWRHSPVRFSVAEEGEQVAVIQRQLLQYYTEAEFA